MMSLMAWKAAIVRPLGNRTNVLAVSSLQRLVLRALQISTLILLGGVSIALSVESIITWANPADWQNLARAGQLAGSAQLYEGLVIGPFRWHPMAAYLLVPLAAIGPFVWAGLHVAAAFAFGNPRITALLLIALPFWHDALSGNVIIFVVLVAWWALRGSQLATGAYLILCLLMPRPLMAPVAIWLLWQRPEWRLPFAGMVGLSVGLAWWSGLGDDWLRVLISSPGEVGHHLNIAPSHWFGTAWLIVEWPLAAWLTYRGRLGLASLAGSPYLFPYYLLFGVLELRRRAVPHGP
jgi:hypothetical protein